jgi:uncharacterized RDD family membrane protein YckC
METTAGCPLCGDSRRMARPKKLYGHPVCRRCWTGFANRRQLAWIIDVFLARTLAIFLGVFLVTRFDQEESLTWVLLAIFFALIAVKDGLFGGRSPGKAITGVKVIDAETGEAIGVNSSIRRNFLLLIPFMPVVVVFQMMGGPRIGDGLAGTRVIWKRYANNQVFLPANAVSKVFE